MSIKEDTRTLAKWLNEEQTGAIDRRALARVLAHLQHPPAAPAQVKITMDAAIAAGDGVLMNEQAALLRECRFALDSLIQKKPQLAGMLCGSTTLGNLRAFLYDYRPQGVFGAATSAQPPAAQPAPVQDIERCIWARNGNTPCPHTASLKEKNGK